MSPATIPAAGRKPAASRPLAAAKAAKGRAASGSALGMPVRSASRSAVRSGSRSAFVDEYIAAAAPFAQPILTHLRELMHRAVPGLEETKKWSMPFFMYHGIIFGNMAGFKQHCSLGLWGGEIAVKMRGEGTVSGGAMGSFGRVSSLADLPPDRELIALFQQAAQAIDSGARTQSLVRPARKAAKPEVEVPAELAASLKQNKAAQKVFDEFSPSCRREYIDWVGQAKREETRLKRAAEAVIWMSEGKRRHWKYENC